MAAKVSIIIPLKEINDYVKESFSYIEKIDYDKSALDVIVLPDIEGVDTVDEQIEICRQKAGIAPGEPVRLYRFEVQRYR